MAENSNVAAKQAPYVGKNDTTDIGGRVRIATGFFMAASALAAGSVINLAKLPKGAKILPSSKIYFESGQGASTTFKVGDEKDDARYLAAVAPGASAASKALDANILAPYVFEDEMMVTATTGTAALTANKKIVFEIFYVVD